MDEIVIKPELRPAIYTRHERNENPVQHNVLVHTTKTGMHGGYIVEFYSGLLHEVVVDNRHSICFLDNLHEEFCFEKLTEGR